MRTGMRGGIGCAAGLLGGDRRSARIEAHAGLVFGLLGKKAEITVAAVQAELARAGVVAGIGTIWRFFERQRITRKKDRARCQQDRPNILMRHPDVAS